MDTFAVFHGNWSSFAYADAHCDGHRWIDPATIKAAADSAKGINSFYWTGGGAKNPDFRWVANHYQYNGWKPYP